MRCDFVQVYRWNWGGEPQGRGEGECRNRKSPAVPPPVFVDVPQRRSLRLCETVDVSRRAAVALAPFIALQAILEGFCGALVSGRGVLG